MRIAFCVAAMLGVWMTAGCSLWRREEPQPAFTAPAPTMTVKTNFDNTAPAPATKDEKLIVTPDGGLNGKIISVKDTLRFAILNFPIGQMPPLGKQLVVYRRGLKVGELKVSGPQQDDNIVADIVAGEAAVGDEVRDQ